MICPVVADLKEIRDQGRCFPWPRPERCPRCRNWRVWGHGYVERYFDGFAESLPLKCYRCPGCGCVMTMRPASYFPRIRSSKKSILIHLFHRLGNGRWPPSPLPHSRLRQWLFNLRRRVHVFLTHTWARGLWAGLMELLYQGQIPVARVS